MALSAAMWLIDVFLEVVRQQWSSMYRGIRHIRLWIHAEYFVDTFIVRLGLHVRFVDNKKNIIYWKLKCNTNILLYKITLPFSTNVANCVSIAWVIKSLTLYVLTLNTAASDLLWAKMIFVHMSHNGMH